MEFKVSRIVFILLLFCVTRQTHSKKILCLLGIGTETAQKWNKILLNELSAERHDLTVITPELWVSDTEANIEFIHLESSKKFVKKHAEENNVTPKILQQSIWISIFNWYDQQMATCRGNLESRNLSEFLNATLKERRTFDMIIYDVTYGLGCLLQFAHIFKDIPIVGITGSTLTSNVLHMNQISILSAALDPYVLSDFGRNMNYWTRLYNMILYGLDYAYRQWVVEPVLEGLWSHYVHDKNLFVSKSVNDLHTRFKVILANHHPALHTLTSLPTNVVPVPGLHIETLPHTSLATDISKFKENFKSGIVLIDLELKQLGELNVQSVFKAVRKFPNFGFIAKADKEMNSIENKPQNLMLENKLRNQEIFALFKADSKLKFVLTIPEILRIQECLFHGIPMITLTLKPEQNYLAKRLEEQGSALNLQLSDLPKLTPMFENVLTNHNLRNAALQLQKSFVNPQNPSLYTAIWWVENLLTNPQANDYLYTASKDSLGFVAKTSLDVILTFQLLILMCCINTILVCRQTMQRFTKISKGKNKFAEKNETKIKKLKKEKKTKAKTS